ncbi:hypothetical protein ACFX15_021512 [Malus domestica]
MSSLVFVHRTLSRLGSPHRPGSPLLAVQAYSQIQAQLAIHSASLERLGRPDCLLQCLVRTLDGGDCVPGQLEHKRAEIRVV